MEVIPLLKGLGVKYCIGWGYGRVLASGDAQSQYRSGLQPSCVLLARVPRALPQAGRGRAVGPLLWRWSCDAGDGVGLEF